MKKLMIAAAAAAMISGAYADVYTFSASLKTTTGKMGKATSVTGKFGKDAAGLVWWRDAEFMGADGATTGKYANVLSAGNSKKPYTIKQADFNKLSAVAQDEIEAVLNNYLDTSAGDCLTLKFPIDAGCYRVAGSKKWEGYAYGTDMCPACTDDLTLDIYEKKADAQVASLSFAPALYNVFGAQTWNKATKCEVADIGAISPALAFAGQGSGKWVNKDALGNDLGYDYFRPTSISGNIIAVLPDPDCEYCCDNDILAMVFDCAGTEISLTAPGTAAYGTWSMKYNAKLDKDYLDNGNVPQPKWF